MNALRTMLICSGALLVAGVLRAGEAPVADAAFSLELSDGRVVREADLERVAAARDGRTQLVVRSPALAVTIERRRSETPAYQRTIVHVTNTGAEELALERIVLADVPAPAATQARVVGDCPGSPVVIGAQFCGVEHPMAQNTVAAGRIRCALRVMQPLRPGEVVTASLVSGTAPEPSQLRRTFLAYIEHERPRPYAPFLHHNTWYSLGNTRPYSEADELQVIAALGRELVQRRGVKLDGFVLDDGWDDTHTLWRFHAGWPARLKNVTAAAARFGAIPGIWMSPWGGYNKPKQARLAAAAGQGFEIRDDGFSLAGPRYRARFRELCVAAISEGVGFFKFDGIGTKTTGRIDPAAGRDFDAMLRLIAELRQLRPGLYVSQTVGTWPSPWWLLHVDNVWRGGEDHAFCGVGSDRQQWITYRDAQVYEHVVRAAPLFPLNSLMLHGIVFARSAERLDADPQGDFRSEVRSFFGSGTQLQELYVTPELLSPGNWNDLAAAARWARANAPTLRDSHWIGGDPVKLQVYGWAAWSPAKAIVTLRNPSDRPANFILDVGAAFELPSGAPQTYRLIHAFGGNGAVPARAEAGSPVTLELNPFEVRVLEATPVD